MDNRAAREVCRALSESRAIATWGGLVVFSHVTGFALLAGERQLALVAGGLTFGCFLALSAHAEPEPDRGPKGEIATMSEPAFERLLQTVEEAAGVLAAGGAVARGAPDPALDDDGFARLVAGALDDLPAFLRDELERNVVVVTSDDGSSHGAYGLYMGGTVADRRWGDRIVIFRDTLVRDFGSDPDVLRRQVTMTVRHELAHHLGAGELHVARLGLSDSRGPRPAKPCGARAISPLRSRPAPAASPAPRRPATGSPRTRAPTSDGDPGALRPPAPPISTSFRRRLAAVKRPSRRPTHRARPPPVPVRTQRRNATIRRGGRSRTMTPTIRSGLLALCALVTALVAPAPAGADAVVANLVRDTPISAYGGWLAWSDYDAASQRYRLVLQVGDQTAPAAMPDSARAFDVSLGPDARGRVVALYTRCRRGDRGCDVYRYDVLARREHKLAGVSSPRLDEAWPAQWRERITFVRRARTYVMDGYDHRPDPRGKRGGGPLMDCDVPYVRTLPARGLARRLDRGQCGVTTGMSIRGDSIVQVSDENQGGAGSESQVRRLRAGGGRSRLLARAGGGEGGYSPFVSASQSASAVWLTRTGNRAPANLLRIDIASGRLTEVAPHLPLAGRLARDERGVFWYVQGPEPPEEHSAEPSSCSQRQPCRLIRASADPFSADTRTLAPRITLSPAAVNAPAPGTGPVAIAGEVTSEVVRGGASLRREPLRGVAVELLRSTGGSGQGTYATTGLTTTTDAAGHWAFAVSSPPSPASFAVIAPALAITSTPIVVGG